MYVCAELEVSSSVTLYFWLFDCFHNGEVIQVYNKKSGFKGNLIAFISSHVWNVSNEFRLSIRRRKNGSNFIFFFFPLSSLSSSGIQRDFYHLIKMSFANHFRIYWIYIYLCADHALPSIACYDSCLIFGKAVLFSNLLWLHRSKRTFFLQTFDFFFLFIFMTSTKCERVGESLHFHRFSFILLKH